MKDIINLYPLSNYLQTSHHIKEVIYALDNLHAEIFKKQRTPLEVLKTDVPFPLSDSLINLAANDYKVDLNSSIDAEMFFKELREQISQLPILTITVAKPPTLDLVKQINDWVIANIKGFAATDFVIDKTLIGGAIIDFQGKTRDHTIKKLITGVSTLKDPNIKIIAGEPANQGLGSRA
jgi:F0F1-type ATP synthase delta subunit